MIHLTPAKLRGQFGGKSGPTKLVHMVMTVARDLAMQPVVIYIDECEQFFAGGKKNKDKEGPSRFKKDLITYKNQALGPEHRVIIIGTTKQVELADGKDLKSFFDKFLFMPYPDYASRVLLWRHYIQQKIRDGLVFNDNMTVASAAASSSSNAPGAASSTGPAGSGNQKQPMAEEEILLRTRLGMEKIDISSLAHVSEGYSAGAIARAVRIIITNRRVTMLKLRPLANLDFIEALAQQDVSYQDDRQVFLEFTKTITGLADRRKKVEAIVSGESTEKKDKKGGKKKK